VECKAHVGLDDFTHAPLLEQHDRVFAQLPHLGALWSRGGAEQGDPRDALRRLARGFHRDHAAHGGSAQHHATRVQRQQGGRHVRDRVVLHVRVGHHGPPGLQGVELRAPHDLVAREAGKQNELCHECDAPG